MKNIALCCIADSDCPRNKSYRRYLLTLYGLHLQYLQYVVLCNVGVITIFVAKKYGKYWLITSHSREAIIVKENCKSDTNTHVCIFKAV